VLKRALRTLIRTRSLTTAIFVLGMNKGWKRMARIQVPLDRKRFGYEPAASARLEKLRRAFRMNFQTGLTRA
jgi:hypothetical protein